MFQSTNPTEKEPSLTLLRDDSVTHVEVRIVSAGLDAPRPLGGETGGIGIMRKGRKEEESVAVKIGSAETLTGTLSWKCTACGAFNDVSEQVCSECTAIRAGAQAVPQAPEAPEAEGLDWETPSLEPEQVISNVEPEQVISSLITPFDAPSQSTPATGQTRYYLVFVGSPAQSIIKSKVSIDFDVFPVISIGRNPENVVVIPDQEVSRRHAELTKDGSKLVIRDLKSKNGTYVYNGKQFEQVSDSVEVKPNSLLKFGTGTIVRLTSE